MKTAAELLALIHDAEGFRTSMAGRQDDSAHYWRVHLAERIYELRVEWRAAQARERTTAAA